MGKRRRVGHRNTGQQKPKGSPNEQSFIRGNRRDPARDVMETLEELRTNDHETSGIIWHVEDPNDNHIKQGRTLAEILESNPDRFNFITGSFAKTFVDGEEMKLKSDDNPKSYSIQEQSELLREAVDVMVADTTIDKNIREQMRDFFYGEAMGGGIMDAVDNQSMYDLNVAMRAVRKILDTCGELLGQQSEMYNIILDVWKIAEDASTSMLQMFQADSMEEAVAEIKLEPISDKIEKTFNEMDAADNVVASDTVVDVDVAEKLNPRDAEPTFHEYRQGTIRVNGKVYNDLKKEVKVKVETAHEAYMTGLNLTQMTEDLKSKVSSFTSFFADTMKRALQA